MLFHVGLSHAGLSLATWLALAAHLYALAWIAGDAHALRHRRTSLRPGLDGCDASLELCVGLRARGHFSLSSIAAVRTGSFDRVGPGEHRVRVCGPANVEISFRHAVLFDTPLRRALSVQRLLLQVDDAERFARVLAEQLAAAEPNISVGRAGTTAAP